MSSPSLVLSASAPEPEPEEENQDQGEPTPTLSLLVMGGREDDPKPALDNTGTTCTNAWGVYTNDMTGLAVSWEAPDGYRVPVTRTAEGLLVAGDQIVAFQHNTSGTVMPAIQSPGGDGREKFNKELALIMNKQGCYCYKGTVHRLIGGKFIPLGNKDAFDGWLANNVIVWSVVVDKENNKAIRLVQLPERTVKQIFQDESLKAQLNQVDSINEVQQPYFPAGSHNRHIVFNPLGYNPDTRTITLGTASHSRHGLAVTSRWFKKLIKDYDFLDATVDVPAVLCQMIGTYCSELFYDFNPDGSRGERYVMPIVLTESNATGSGKTTLMKMMSLPALGVTAESEAKHPEEVAKQMTTAVLEGEKYYYLDEVKRTQGDNLLTAVTGTHKGRVLGVNKGVRGDLIIMMSGCNTEFSEMLARRIIACKLLTTKNSGEKKLSRVIEKGDFQKLRPHLLTHVRNMVLRWQELECPTVDGGNEWARYAQIVGGILLANGYRIPFKERTGAVIMDVDATDAQLPGYLHQLDKKVFSLSHGSEQWKDVEMLLQGFKQVLQDAGYYLSIREDSGGLASLGRQLKAWNNTPRPVIPGVWLRSRHTRKGKMVWFASAPGAQPTHSMSASGEISKISSRKNEQQGTATV